MSIWAWFRRRVRTSIYRTRSHNLQVLYQVNDVMETQRIHQSGYGYRRLLILLSVLFYLTSELSLAAIESLPSSSSSSDYEEDYDNYQRRTLLPPSKNRNNQITSKLSTSPTPQQPVDSKTRNRRDQSKDLKKLIQELEESDYSNYGSWGNFRQRPPVAKKSGIDRTLCQHVLFKGPTSTIFPSYDDYFPITVDFTLLHYVCAILYLL